MRNSSNRLFYYLNDHLGSARVLLDSTGLIYDHYRYRAFGEPGTSVVNTGQPNRYTGKPYDVDDGLNLYYYGARYYDATLGRFTQTDPSRGKYPEWGPYVYALDNPLRFIDPDGLRVTNPDEIVLSNTSVERHVVEFNSEVARISATPTTDFTFVVTGGDRYVRDGKVYSSTNNQVVSGTSLLSRHITSNGALGVDLRVPSNISIADIKKAAKNVGFEEIINRYPDGHLHLALPKSEKSAYLKDTRVDKTYSPTFQETEQPTEQRKEEKNKNARTEKVED